MEVEVLLSSTRGIRCDTSCKGNSSMVNFARRGKKNGKQVSKVRSTSFSVVISDEVTCSHNQECLAVPEIK